jgi:hypothetical protein
MAAGRWQTGAFARDRFAIGDLCGRELRRADLHGLGERVHHTGEVLAGLRIHQPAVLVVALVRPVDVKLDVDDARTDWVLTRDRLRAGFE